MVIPHATLDLQIDRGADFELELILTDAADDPMDLTDCAVSAGVAELPGGTVFLDLNAAVTDALAGKISISAPRADTTAVTRTAGVWDLQVLDAADQLRRKIAGNVNLPRLISPPPA